MKNINNYIIEKFKISKDNSVEQNIIFDDSTKMLRRINSILSCLGETLKTKSYWKKKVKQAVEDWITLSDVKTYRIIFGSEGIYEKDLTDRVKKLIDTCVSYKELDKFEEEYELNHSNLIKNDSDGVYTWDHHREEGDIYIYKRALKFRLLIYSGYGGGDYWYVNFLVTKES